MLNQKPSRERQSHLLFLDGIRGLAALYVVALHILMQIDRTYSPASLGGAFLRNTQWLHYGQVSVDIFIVLSGFCLMLPVARGNGYLRGGFRQFALRRAQRILPPYYAAVCLSLFLIWLLPCLSHPDNGLWQGALPAFSTGAIISHLLLVHNWSHAWFFKIDYPIWTVATEWQIYFIFALLLLPISRRFGNLAMLAAAFAVAYIPPHFLHQHSDGGLSMLVLFAFGMCAATAVYSSPVNLKVISPPAVWGSACLAAALALFFLAGHHRLFLAIFGSSDRNVGVVTAIVLFLATTRPQQSALTSKIMDLVVRILESRAFVVLGSFSYSLYVIHAPLIAIMFAVVRVLHADAVATFLICEIVGLPLCIAGAYGFHLIFERPFMSVPKPKTEPQSDVPGVALPAR